MINLKCNKDSKKTEDEGEVSTQGTGDQPPKEKNK